MTQPDNPYGARPGGGISLPDYYRPMTSINNRNFYSPGTEILPEGEMRISILGSTPWPPTRLQAGTCILVECGNGQPQPRRFFFDMGNGSVKNALAMQVPPIFINDIFISHLHGDHYADLPYMYPFTAWAGRWQPLRLYGPSGATPELGIKHMAKHMREMMRWHEENFLHATISAGYEMDVTEFDWKEENGICYDQDGIVVRHWPRSHVKDGASAYRLDWEDAGLSVVWTGDGRPDEKTEQYAAGCDVFITEGQIDTPSLMSLKFGVPEELAKYTIDSWHTMYYAAGYLMNKVQPRMGMIVHYEAGGAALDAESVAEVRANYEGLFQFGGPDIQVVNVTKDRIWSREAAIPDGAAIAPLDPRWLLPSPLPAELELPRPELPREQQQQAFLREMEIDPHKYYPPDADREPVQSWPAEGFKIDPRGMLRARGIDPDES
ncbi:guanitoxin biosynthesis MBL fold metallo-hydrolase GntH [Rhodococcus xishaensis]|uniref:guanitoxin biosynthesis MBL fold metallo-hydrolase GntH n=1 Tax=Rhodococcus xishaensis TaxID=2487364 RepID=UPI0019D48935|nr:guanitoxin biosynthesis MBL fold metallo-hydrolase GntH [Rhodococcus xishaensis]